jgi:hypothetical protein
MQKLDKFSVSEFLDRFYSFNDGLLRKVEIVYLGSGERMMSVRIATRDKEETKNDGWVCLHLVISGLSDYRISENANSSVQVFSHGLHIIASDEGMGFDFGSFVDIPESISELKKSNFFAIGESVEWCIEAY